MITPRSNQDISDKKMNTKCDWHQEKEYFLPIGDRGTHTHALNKERDMRNDTGRDNKRGAGPNKINRDHKNKIAPYL